MTPQGPSLSKRIWVCTLLGLATLGLTALTVAVVIWGFAHPLPPYTHSFPQPLGVISLPLILLGLAAMTLNELRCCWPKDVVANSWTWMRRLDGFLWNRTGPKSVFRVADEAFSGKRRRWFVGVYLGIELAVGALTMHFTRVVGADWTFLAGAVLVFVNGAIIAYGLEVAVASDPVTQPAAGAALGPVNPRRRRTPASGRSSPGRAVRRRPRTRRGSASPGPR